LSLIQTYGFTAFCENRSDPLPEREPSAEALVAARVCAVQRDRFTIVSDSGFSCARVKTAEFRFAPAAAFPAVGDFVLVRPNPSGDDLICAVLPRKTFFSRLNPTPGAGEQIVAANFDIVLIVTSVNRDFNVRRLERYLAATVQSGARPVLVLTKADLCAAPDDWIAKASQAAPGAGVIAVSAHTGFGMDSLRALLAPGTTAVLLGSSGTGKSSLVNALSGGERMKVKSIREDDDRGRHTTTHRELFLLDSGAILIDTPGMRVLGLWNAEEGIAETFADIGELASSCRFPDCSHGAEPGCAVRAALEEGSLDAKRWAQYQKLEKESAYSENPEGYAARKQEKFRDISKWSKELQKRRDRF
jgi:ribosome small subunit-dependent GTPase A